MRTVLMACVGMTIVAGGATHTAAANPQNEGLTLVAAGSAAFYSPSYDGAGWEAIVQRHLAWGQDDPAQFPYDAAGHYCVQPDFDFGNILTIRNGVTGATMRCTIGDTVAPQDQPNWRRHVVIELSYAAFRDLGLADDNDVEVWAKVAAAG